MQTVCTATTGWSIIVSWTSVDAQQRDMAGKSMRSGRVRIWTLTHADASTPVYLHVVFGNYILHSEYWRNHGCVFRHCWPVSICLARAKKHSTRHFAQKVVVQWYLDSLHMWNGMDKGVHNSYIPDETLPQYHATSLQITNVRSTKQQSASLMIGKSD